MTFDDLNWLAIAVATLAWFAFSAIWYSVPPLSQAWQRASKVDMSGDGPSLVLLAIPTLVAYFATSLVIASLARGLGLETAGEGALFGVLLGIGFGMASALVTQVYEAKGPNYFLINGLNHVIAFAIVGTIVTVWT